MYLLLFLGEKDSFFLLFLRLERERKREEGLSEEEFFVIT